MAKAHRGTTGTKSADIEVLTIPGLDAWRELAQFAPAEDAQGYTVRELMKSLEMSEGRVYRMLRAGIDSGVIEFAGKRAVQSISAGIIKTPVYRLKENHEQQNQQ